MKKPKTIGCLTILLAVLLTACSAPSSQGAQQSLPALNSGYVDQFASQIITIDTPLYTAFDLDFSTQSEPPQLLRQAIGRLADAKTLDIASTMVLSDAQGVLLNDFSRLRCDLTGDSPVYGIEDVMEMPSLIAKTDAYYAQGILYRRVYSDKTQDQAPSQTQNAQTPQQARKINGIDPVRYLTMDLSVFSTFEVAQSEDYLFVIATAPAQSFQEFVYREDPEAEQIAFLGDVTCVYTLRQSGELIDLEITANSRQQVGSSLCEVEDYKWFVVNALDEPIEIVPL